MGFINQLITGGHHPATVPSFFLMKKAAKKLVLLRPVGPLRRGTARPRTGSSWPCAFAWCIRWTWRWTTGTGWEAWERLGGDDFVGAKWMGKLWKNNGKLWKTMEKTMENHGKTMEKYGKQWKTMDKWRGLLYMARVSDHQVSDGNLWTFGWVAGVLEQVSGVLEFLGSEKK